MVDWKKDIKLSDLLARNRGDDAVDETRHSELEPDIAPEQAAQQPAVEADEHAVADDLDTVEESEPFWKRDLTFGRRKEADESEVGVGDPDDRGGQITGTPFWKREITFGRRKDDTVRDPEFDTPTEEPGQSFWKRELSFGRRKDDVWPDAPEAGAEPPADKTVETDTPEVTPPFWKRELGFGRPQEETPPGAPPDTPEAEHDEAPAEIVAAARDEAETPVEPSFEQEPHPPEPVDFEPDRVKGDDVPSAPFWKRELKLGRGRAQREPDHDPMHGTEEEPSEARPFWKRELSFGRRKDDAVDVHDAPAAADEATHEQPDDSFAAADEDEKPPLWKRRLAFGRAEDKDFETPEAEEETEKRPFFKRDLGFRRSKDAEADLPQSDTEDSFFKRIRSLRRSEDPDFDAPAQTGEKKPFLKRDFSLRRGARATHDRAGAGPAKSGRRKQMIGLKVGASQIAAARVVNNGSPELVQLARQSIEQGIVVGGELRDPDALTEALREFFARHKLPNRNVRLGIGNNRIGVRSFEISGVHDPKQLENAVRFRAQEALPIPLDEAVLDYHVIDENVSPTGIRTYRVLLVVAYRELIDRYVAACRGAGLRLVGIDLEAFALLRALSPPPSEAFPEDTALVAVSIGHDRSTFAVSNGTVCEFTRVLDWGGSSLNTAIARALDVTPSQAEPVKRTLTLSGGNDGATVSANEHTARAEEAVRLELQSFARELVSSLHFYQNQPGSLAIGAIVLTGGTAHLPGLAAELQRLIGVKVRVGDPLRRMKTGRRVETPDQVGSLSIAIGLGIED
jgi:type IV pilus assembly protein PilM